MNKLIRDGKVAVLVSPGFGAGWSTWGDVNVFDPVIAQAVLDKLDSVKITELAEQRYPGEYHGGAADLRVVWVPEGTLFRIEEYDGSESLVTLEDYQWEKA